MENIEENPGIPEHLDEYGAGLWKRAIKNLKDMGTLHQADFDVLAQYCFLAEQNHKLAPEIAAEGSTIIYVNKENHANVRVNPKLRVFNENLGHIQRLAKDFGFTPASRKTIGAKKEKETTDFDGI